MLNSIFATKLDMTQAWSTQGKRLAVTRCRVDDNVVVEAKSPTILEIGYGHKKLANMTKPLRSKLQKGGFSFGLKQLRGLHVEEGVETNPAVGATVKVDAVLEVGDVVKVRGTTKGRGFAGVVKRHGFHGGPATHGQSDRQRAPGSIGAGTDPGRIWKGQRMAGHMGVDTKTVAGLVVLFIDSNTGEVWLSGPIPGHFSSTVQITKTGEKKAVEIDKKASGIAEAPVVEASVEEQPAVAEEPVVEEAPVETPEEVKTEENNAGN